MLHRNHAKNLSSRDLIDKNKEEDLCVTLQKQILSEQDSNNIKINLDKKKIKSVMDYQTYLQLTKPKQKSLYCSGKSTQYIGHNYYEELYNIGTISDLQLTNLGSSFLEERGIINSAPILTYNKTGNNKQQIINGYVNGCSITCRNYITGEQMGVIRDELSTTSVLNTINYTDIDGFFSLNIPVDSIGDDVIFIIDCCGGTIDFNDNNTTESYLFNGHFFKILRTNDPLWIIDGYTKGQSYSNELYNIFITLATINSLRCDLLSICNELNSINNNTFILNSNIKANNYSFVIR